MVKPTVLAESMTLTHSDSGKTYFLNAAGGFEMTLPSPRGGINFEFIVKTVPTTADYVIGSEADAKIIMGQVITSNVKAPNDAVWEQTGSSQLKFLYPDTRVGDSVEIISDGTYWYVTAFCSSFDAITIAEQSKSASASTSASPSTSPSASPSTSPSVSPSTST
ncbi:MAG: hypothetical protein ACTSRU_08620 [Candidatus Hodarchaeales archaeon]